MNNKILYFCVMFLMVIFLSTLNANPINTKNYSKLVILNKTIALKTGFYSIDFGKSDVSIAIYKRGNEDDPMSSTQLFESIEQSINGVLDPYFFGLQNHKVIINNAVWINSIVISMFDSYDKRISRRILTTTKDCFIVIEMKLKKKFEDIVFLETPNYFINRNGSLVWDIDKDKIELFAKNIVNMQLESKIGNDWYLETNKVLVNLNLK